MPDYDTYKPLEERLGSREKFEAHQESEAERTARVLARRQKATRDAWVFLAGMLLIITVVGAAIYLLGRG